MILKVFNAAPLLQSAAIFALLFLSSTISAKLFSILTGPAHSSPIQSVLYVSTHVCPVMSSPVLSVLSCPLMSVLLCPVKSCLSCSVLSSPVQSYQIPVQFSKLFQMKNTMQPAQPYLDSFYCLVDN